MLASAPFSAAPDAVNNNNKYQNNSQPSDDLTLVGEVNKPEFDPLVVSDPLQYVEQCIWEVKSHFCLPWFVLQDWVCLIQV